MVFLWITAIISCVIQLAVLHRTAAGRRTLRYLSLLLMEGLPLGGGLMYTGRQARHLSRRAKAPRIFRGGSRRMGAVPGAGSPETRRGEAACIPRRGGPVRL